MLKKKNPIHSFSKQTRDCPAPKQEVSQEDTNFKKPRVQHKKGLKRILQMMIKSQELCSKDREKPVQVGAIRVLQKEDSLKKNFFKLKLMD